MLAVAVHREYARGAEFQRTAEPVLQRTGLALRHIVANAFDCKIRDRRAGAIAGTIVDNDDFSTLRQCVLHDRTDRAFLVQRRDHYHGSGAVFRFDQNEISRFKCNDGATATRNAADSCRASAASNGKLAAAGLPA